MKIKTYEEACKKLKIKPTDFSNIPVEVHSFIKLLTIVKAINEGWIPDWTNSSERKYIIWWYFKNGAFVFDCYRYWSSFTNVPAGLCFKSAELAKYCGKTFVELWNDYLQYV